MKCSDSFGSSCCFGCKPVGTVCPEFLVSCLGVGSSPRRTPVGSPIRYQSWQCWQHVDLEIKDHEDHMDQEDHRIKLRRIKESCVHLQELAVVLLCDNELVNVLLPVIVYLRFKHS